LAADVGAVGLLY